MTRGSAAIAVLLLLVAARVRAQEGCVPPKDSHEEKLFRKFSVPLAYGPLMAPEPPAAGSIALALEVTYLPEIDSATRTPDYCRTDKGPEDINRLSALPRPRVRFGLPSGFALEASWVPPVEVKGIKSNLFGVSLERTVPLPSKAPGMAVRLRAHGTFGEVSGAITCPEEAIADPANTVCFGGTKSDDSYKPNMFGLDASVALPLGGQKLRGYGGLGANWLRPRFQVGFTNAAGDVDNTKVETNLTRFAYFGGLTWKLGDRFAASGEVYGQASDAITGRVALAWTLRGGAVSSGAP